jgi:hypothetical protein
MRKQMSGLLLLRKIAPLSRHVHVRQANPKRRGPIRQNGHERVHGIRPLIILSRQIRLDRLPAHEWHMMTPIAMSTTMPREPRR